MNQVRHLFSKDLRRLRWSIIGWSALVGARTLINTVGADIALGGFGPQLGIGELSAVLSLMYLLLLALLVSRLVHDEPLVGRDAFWITRPIAPGALMAAKLLFATLFFIVLPLAGSVIVAAAFGTSAADIARTIPVFALNQFILVTLLMALATVTPSLTRYVLAMVGVIAAVVTLTASTILLMLWVTEEIQESSDAGLPDPTPAVVGGMLIVLIALAVIIYQYRTRRLGRALTIAGIGAAVLLLVLERWNWSFADQPRFETTAAPQDTPALTVSLDGSRPRVSDTFTMRRRTPPRKEIAAHAIVAGVPPEFNVRPIVARSRLELPAGQVLQTGGNTSNAVLSVYGGGSTAGRTTTVEAALGGVRLLTRSNALESPSSEQWPILLRVDEGDFVRHRDQPGRLTANLDLIFERAVARDALPLADGATRDISAIARPHRSRHPPCDRVHDPAAALVCRIAVLDAALSRFHLRAAQPHARGSCWQRRPAAVPGGIQYRRILHVRAARWGARIRARTGTSCIFPPEPRQTARRSTSTTRGSKARSWPSSRRFPPGASAGQ